MPSFNHSAHKTVLWLSVADAPQGYDFTLLSSVSFRVICDLYQSVERLEA
jgi:hypothetical protein